MFLKLLWCDVEGKRRAGGKQFQAIGPATANAWSPIAERRVDGTTRLADDNEHKQRRAVVTTRGQSNT